MITRITNIGQLVTPEGRGAAFGAGMSDLRVREGAEVVIQDGRIESIGPSGGRGDVTQTIDAGGRVVLPGLIDPHRHFGAPPTSTEGRLPPVSPVSNATDANSVEKRLLRGFRRAALSGTSMIEIKCGAGEEATGEVENLARAQQAARSSALRVAATLFADCGSATKTEWSRDDRISAMISELIPAARRRRLARFCDVACGDGAYTTREAQAILRAARGAGLTPKVHAVGSESEAAALLGEKLGAASVDHLTAHSPRASAALRRSGVVCVLLPGADLLFDRPAPDARRMIDDGMAVALGTDFSFLKAGVESTWIALSLGLARMGMTLEEGIIACTLNAAAALEAADEAGSIEPGKLGDLVILDVDDYREIPGSIGGNPVWMALIGGRPVPSL